MENQIKSTVGGTCVNEVCFVALVFFLFFFFLFYSGVIAVIGIDTVRVWRGMNYSVPHFSIS